VTSIKKLGAMKAIMQMPIASSSTRFKLSGQGTVATLSSQSFGVQVTTWIEKI